MNSKSQTKHIHTLNEHLQIHFDQSWVEDIENRFESNGPWDDWTLYQLAYESENTKLVTDFDELQSLNQLSNVEPMPHQISTAKKVLTGMRGRAILADEVGLGKTIEAGLILKEYMIRQLVKKVLILVPASLVLQWVRELNQKFNIPAVAQKKAYMWDQYDIIVASVDTAKRNPHRDIVLDKEYDMLIVDEAHKLKNKKTTNYQFINSVRKKYCLLLTATPIQNDLKELYNLITILKPGQLGGDSQFKTNYVVDKRIPKNEIQLRDELSNVMIRNRRSDGYLDLTKRNVKNISLTLSDEEYDLYQSVTDFVRKRAEDKEGGISHLFSLITLQREVCSSRDAVFLTLVNLFKKTSEDSPVRAMIWELVDKIKKVKSHTKAKNSLELIQKINDKVIIFTEYRATQEYLLSFLKEHQIISVPYRGGMNRGKKDWMMDLFRKRAQVMVATEAGGEGINLQFCNHVINYDLPWNPMRVEQRIGRVHRLGQKNDVHIYNLSTEGTIEEHILHLLHEKINLFESVIGGLDLILERLEKKSSIEKNLYKIILESQNESEMRTKLNDLGDSFTKVKSEIYNHQIIDQPETEVNP
nr:SNF2-related protein [Chengkuizengella sediminis]